MTESATKTDAKASVFCVSGGVGVSLRRPTRRLTCLPLRRPPLRGPAACRKTFHSPIDKLCITVYPVHEQ